MNNRYNGLQWADVRKAYTYTHGGIGCLRSHWPTLWQFHGSFRRESPRAVRRDAILREKVAVKIGFPVGKNQGLVELFEKRNFWCGEGENCKL